MECFSLIPKGLSNPKSFSVSRVDHGVAEIFLFEGVDFFLRDGGGEIGGQQFTAPLFSLF